MKNKLFILGVILIALSSIIGWSALSIGGLMGIKYRILFFFGVAVWGVSWILFALGVAIAGREGILASKKLIKKINIFRNDYKRKKQ